jgi:radical SAM protein with 4Fe4S-binding SPASM domain
MGDPLISRMKGVTLKAINKILSNNETQKDPKPVKIGLFTNGLEMTEDTWETLSQISYIHISLDAGQYTYRQVKRKRKTQSNFLYQDQDNSFFNILKNINGLNDYCRKKNESRIIKQNGKDAAKLEINIGFVIVPENYLEIPETTKMVKDKGADSIRFKCDIGDMHVLNDDMLNVISNIINKARIENTVNEGKEEKAFQVYMIHSVDDIRDKKHKQWRCSDGCYIHNFFSTIGSDGNFYSCDHNTIKPNKSFGSVLTDNPLTKIWLSAEKKYLNEHLKEFCKCKVCPPFGNEANPFLDKVREYIDLGFTKEVLLVIDRIRQEYKKQDKR